MTSSQTLASHLIISWRGCLLATTTLRCGAATAWIAARAGAAFPDVLEPVELAMSVPVPFFGVLAVADLHQSQAPSRRQVTPRLIGALVLALGFALIGALLAATVTVPHRDVWPPAGRTAMLVTAAVLVQLIAQLTGIGWGLLLRHSAVAMAATVLVPMTVTVLLSGIDPDGGLVRWLTPYGNARSLLAGKPTPATLAGLGVVMLLWGVLPNLLGTRHVNRNAPRCR